MVTPNHARWVAWMLMLKIKCDEPCNMPQTDGEGEKEDINPHRLKQVLPRAISIRQKVRRRDLEIYMERVLVVVEKCGSPRTRRVRTKSEEALKIGGLKALEGVPSGVEGQEVCTELGQATVDEQSQSMPLCHGCRKAVQKSRNRRRKTDSKPSTTVSGKDNHSPQTRSTQTERNMTDEPKHRKTRPEATVVNTHPQKSEQKTLESELSKSETFKQTDVSKLIDTLNAEREEHRKWLSITIGSSLFLLALTWAIMIIILYRVWAGKDTATDHKASAQPAFSPKPFNHREKPFMQQTTPPIEHTPIPWPRYVSKAPTLVPVTHRHAYRESSRSPTPTIAEFDSASLLDSIPPGIPIPTTDDIV